MKLLHVKLCENLFDVGRQFCLKREKSIFAYPLARVIKSVVL